MDTIDFRRAAFKAAYGTPEQLPEPTNPEVAFVGRSNVGKSSLLNALVGRKALAKVSSKPGKTSTINFFDVDGVDLVDLPGYGFAKVSAAEKDRWARLIGGYFDQERSFNLVVSLMDIRHAPSDLDRQMAAFLSERGLPFIVALTKADKLSRQKQLQQRSMMARELGLPEEALVITSAEKGSGLDELKRFIVDACL